MARPNRSRPRRNRTVLQLVVGVVVLVVAAAVVLAALQGSRGKSTEPAAGTGAGVGGSSAAASSAGTSAGVQPATPEVAAAVGSVPAFVFDTIGAGTAQAAPTKITAPALSEGGKPAVLYVGAEFCPYCAAERWPLAVALARFGSFSNLGETSSAASPEPYPGTATLSFHGASYTSDYLALTAKEVKDRAEKPLDTLTDAEQKVFDTYDAPPYTQGTGSIPFVDLGGGRVLAGAQYVPDVLAGKTQAQIAAALSDPSSPIAQAVIGSANVLTVGLCEQTQQQPASVCQSKGVQAAAAAMGAK